MTRTEELAASATLAMRDVGRRFLELRRALPGDGGAQALADALRDAIRDANGAVRALADALTSGAFETPGADELSERAEEAREEWRESR